ncbi:exonuclease SbcC [Fictibacillus halophilus]|uniref:Nuclease SbcCD subunit C n=1 Tax=Fictibacillus halophilus TaxID=1610490 RepID=A0ABV2LNT0_9BACL|nr:SMC family ATPase [Fictibacillus halophilus]
MFIQKIILDNFRIFRGRHEFDFSYKKVVVVEGPNGHGKSTIFDAINWVISGKISRYVGSSEHQQFNYIINSDAYSLGLDEASVEIYFNNQEEVVIKRTVKANGSTKLFINGHRFGIRDGQKEIVRLLVNEKVINDTNLFDSIDLPSFIESTLILSQENLEEFVRGNKPTQRYSKLEQILGLTRYGQDFKDYLQVLKKECLTQYDDILLKEKNIKHEQELLNVQYKQKSLQNERNGNKPESKIIDELNTFFSSSMESFEQLNKNEEFFEITINEYEVLKKYIEEIDDKLKRLVDLKFEIQQKEININDIEFNKKIANLHNEISILQIEKVKREGGIEKANSIKEKLNKIAQTNAYLDIKKIEKEKIDIDIKNLIEKLKVISKNLEIDYASLVLKKITDFIEEFRENSTLLDSLLEKSLILENENREFNLIKEKRIIREQNDKNIQLIKDLEKGIEDTENDIFNLTKQKKTNLDSQIYALIHEVQIHLINSNEQKCLVCGGSYNNSEELKNSIRIQLDNSNELLNGFEKKINKYKVSKNELNIKLDVAKQESMVTQEKLNNLNNELVNLKDKTVNMRLQNSISLEDPQLIRKEIVKAQKYKNNNQNKYKGFIEINKILVELNNLKFKRKGIYEEEENAINQHRSYKDFVRKENKLQLKFNKIDSYLSLAHLKVQEYNKKTYEFRQHIQDMEREIQLLNKIKNELENSLNYKLNLDSKEILNVIIENISLFEKRKFEARNLLVTIGDYLNDIELRELQIKIKSFNQKNLILQKQIHQYLTMDNQLKNLLAYHTQEQSSLVNEYLNGLSLTINNYFRQISPHSYFNYINLVTRKNELFVLLKDNQFENDDIEENIDDSVNASLTLSAAQSTILAMSIFLALNKSQNWSKLNLIGIDDPFQNLDDINAYSFIDVMANLISLENRQILISTHDSDFAKLSIRKMNLNPNEYAYVKIQSYTRDAIEIQLEQYKSLEDKRMSF